MRYKIKTCTHHEEYFMNITLTALNTQDAHEGWCFSIKEVRFAQTSTCSTGHDETLMGLGRSRAWTCKYNFADLSIFYLDAMLHQKIF